MSATPQATPLAHIPSLATMATITIGTSLNPATNNFLNIRDGINVLTSGTVEAGNELAIVSGTYDITAFDASLTQNSNATYCGYFNTGLSRFAATGNSPINYFNMHGYFDEDVDPAAITTTITKLTRIYAGAKDLGFSRPSDWKINNLNLNFDFASGSEYILQGGNYGTTLNAVKGLALANINFTGTHVGSANSGAYSDLRGADDLSFDNVTVDPNFGAQQTYTAGTTTTYSSGGSAFLFAQGSNISVTNSHFDELKYGNSVTLYDSTNILLQSNTFDAGGQLKQIGQVVSNTTGEISSNTFRGGTFLNVAKPVAGSLLNITSNTFLATNSDASRTVVGAKGICLEPNAGDQSFSQFSNVNISGNQFTDVIPIVTTISTGGTAYKTASNQVFNPVVNSLQTFGAIYVGGTGSDTVGVSSSTSSDFLIGAEGNDTLTGGTGADAFAFTVAPGTANADVITDFKAGSAVDKIWLDDAIFTALSKGGFNTGAPNANKFYSGAAAGTVGTINYQTGTKQLWYDSTNTGKFTDLICTLSVNAVAIGDLVVF